MAEQPKRRRSAPKTAERLARMLVIVPYVALTRGRIASYHPLATSVPPLTLLNLNLLGKMALGALSGFEHVAIVNDARDGSGLLDHAPVLWIER